MMSNNELAEDLVLFILGETGGQLRGATRLQKIAFLIVMETGVKGIEFEPSEYGPYSRDIANAVKELEKRGLIVVRHEVVPESDKGYREVYELASRDAAKHAKERLFGWHVIRRGIARDIVWLWKDAPLIALIEYVYRKYPEYAAKSLIKDKVEDLVKALSRMYSL